MRPATAAATAGLLPLGPECDAFNPGLPMSTSPTSSDDRTPAQGQGVGLSVQQGSPSTLDVDLDGISAAVEAELATVPAERVAGYLSRILEDLPRLGLPTQAVTAALGRAYQTLLTGATADAYAQLRDTSRELSTIADRAPEELGGWLQRLAELLR